MVKIMNKDGFYVFIYANEFSTDSKSEPLHVHVNKTGIKDKGSKFWVYPTVRQENNDARLKSHDITKVEKILNDNQTDIVEKLRAIEHMGGGRGIIL